MPTPSETTQLKLALIALGFAVPVAGIGAAVVATPLPPSAPAKAAAKAPIYEAVYAESYLKARERHVEEVYEDNVRTQPLLEDVEDLEWNLVPPQPSSERKDVFANLGRAPAPGFEEALENASVNRLETYDDEAPLLPAVEAKLRDKPQIDAPLGDSKGFPRRNKSFKYPMTQFLKKLAEIAQAGDRTRIEQYFDNLLIVDFFADHGRYVPGRDRGAFNRYLAKYVKPAFVKGVLQAKQPPARMVGLATLAIPFDALSLAESALDVATRSIEWLVRIKPTDSTASVGWRYTVGDVSVVLYTPRPTPKLAERPPLKKFKNLRKPADRHGKLEPYPGNSKGLSAGLGK